MDDTGQGSDATPDEGGGETRPRGGASWADNDWASAESPWGTPAGEAGAGTTSPRWSQPSYAPQHWSDTRYADVLSPHPMDDAASQTLHTNNGVSHGGPTSTGGISGRSGSQPQPDDHGPRHHRRDQPDEPARDQGWPAPDGYDHQRDGFAYQQDDFQRPRDGYDHQRDGSPRPHDDFGRQPDGQRQSVSERQPDGERQRDFPHPRDELERQPDERQNDDRSGVEPTVPSPRSPRGDERVSQLSPPYRSHGSDRQVQQVAQERTNPGAPAAADSSHQQTADRPGWARSWTPSWPPSDPAAGDPTGQTRGGERRRDNPGLAAAHAEEHLADSAVGSLPQRVPAEPDVPAVPEQPGSEPHTETPELARIATHLRREDEPGPPHERPDGFDVDAIVTAVRSVEGVRDAWVRTTPEGAHRLRLDLADGADPAEVSRQVARLLQERMGLAAAPPDASDASAAPATGSAAPAQPVVARRRRRFTGQRPGTPAGTTRPAGRTGAADRPGVAGEALPDPGGAGDPAAHAETGTSRPLSPGKEPGPRVVIDHVQVSTFGMDATVEVRLAAGERDARGLATGPAVDGYVLRLCAGAAAAAIDELLRTSERARRGRCFIEHAAVVPMGSCEVAVVVVLFAYDNWVEQLSGSALVAGDPRQAVVRATLAALNRRLSALLA